MQHRDEPKDAQMRARLSTLTVAAALVAAACASSGAPEDASDNGDVTGADSTVASQPVDTAATPVDTAAPTTTADTPTTAAETTTTIDPAEAETIEQINEYIQQAAGFDQAAADAQIPEGLEFAAGGAPGYSRYVFREGDFGVLPTLVEGPLENTVRCQDPELPLSLIHI